MLSLKIYNQTVLKTILGLTKRHTVQNDSLAEIERRHWVLTFSDDGLIYFLHNIDNDRQNHPLTTILIDIIAFDMCY